MTEPVARQDGAPAGPATLPSAAARRALSLRLLGLDALERQLIEGVVTRSQDRAVPLRLLDARSDAPADVLIVDARERRCANLAARVPNLAERAVIWVDGANTPYGHLMLHRPVMWQLLPQIVARALAHHVALRELRAARNPAPVLLVESDPDARCQLAQLLERRGAAVTEVGTSGQALEALACARFDWTLLGMQPDPRHAAIDRHAACLRVKAQAPAMPVVMLGREASAFEQIRAGRAGATALLTLPFDIPQLYGLVDRCGPGPR